jgi:RNA polymerase sigma-70 factor (ECF subfamily)
MINTQVPENSAFELSDSQAGATAELEQYLKDNRHVLLAKARKMLGSEADAEDAVQNASLNALKGIHSFQRGSLISTWLYRILHNECLMIMRKKGRSAVKSFAEIAGDDEEREINPVDEDDSLPDNNLRELVKILDPEDQKLLIRHYEDDETYEEIAKDMDSTTSSIKMRLFRARQRLKGVLGEAA